MRDAVSRFLGSGCVGRGLESVMLSLFSWGRSLESVMLSLVSWGRAVWAEASKV